MLYGLHLWTHVPHAVYFPPALGKTVRPIRRHRLIKFHLHGTRLLPRHSNMRTPDRFDLSAPKKEKQRRRKARVSRPLDGAGFDFDTHGFVLVWVERASENALDCA